MGANGHLNAALLAMGLSVLSGCGGGAMPTTATTLARAPETPAMRQRAVNALGERAWEALREGRPNDLLFDDLELRNLLTPPQATRASATRHEGGGAQTELSAALRDASYVGICVQGARQEPETGVLGLQAAAWTADRILIIGQRPDRSRIAAWIEGSFVYTDSGFGAIVIESVETPRWEHSDLDLAPCDVGVRIPRSPDE